MANTRALPLPGTAEMMSTEPVSQSTTHPATSRVRSKKPKDCRYFGTQAGCKAGIDCHFRHDQTKLAQIGSPSSNPTPQGLPASKVVAETPKLQIHGSRRPAEPSRVVSKPIPKAQIDNPREFQLGQIRRRYSPKERIVDDPDSIGVKDTLLEFKLRPSDPDFPFEMEALQCVLIVPTTYPTALPRLRVQNVDIPRGFAINIERGFEGLVADGKHSTLLALISALDKNLEAFLSEKKAETITFVANADKRHLKGGLVDTRDPPIHEKPRSQVDLLTRIVQKPVAHSHEEKTLAQQRRETETRQLEARLGRLPLYRKSADGVEYTIPITLPKRSELPSSLQALRAFKLFVPMLYPLEPCRIQVEGPKHEDTARVEAAFLEKARLEDDVALMGRINNLAQNMHIMARSSANEASAVKPTRPSTGESELLSKPNPHPATDHLVPSTDMSFDRGHIKIIARPPEWTMIGQEDAETTDDDFSYDTGDETEDDENQGGTELQAKDVSGSATAPVHSAEKGTAISFPFLELYGLELLDLISLNLTVKCERCKDTMDVTNLKSGMTRSESCKKCATPLTATFRHELMHSMSTRAGFLDLVGCLPVDMLPSLFSPTCNNCSTTYPLPGIVSVRGETVSNVCRECHQKFTFKIPDVKFLRISNTAHLPSAGPRRKKETLGLTAGSELPRRGRCKHYSKSLRWFRFSCCSKVYPCDRCHDEGEEHVNEHANRMICGWCSREQNFRPEDCGVCHGILVGKKGSGFWEGGKGTRDKTRMSRKDPRKYRRPAVSKV